MGTTTKAKMLIGLVMITFGLAVLGNYYNTVLESDENDKGVSKMLNFAVFMGCMFVLMFGLDVKQYKFVDVKGGGMAYAMLMLLAIGTIIFTTAKTWANCKGNDDECLKDQRVGFFVLTGLSALFLFAYIATSAKKKVLEYAQQQKFA